jgi:hypothetical protein
VQFQPRVLSALIDEHGGEASFERILNVAEHFQLTDVQARHTVCKVTVEVLRWNHVPQVKSRQYVVNVDTVTVFLKAQPSLAIGV